MKMLVPIDGSENALKAVRIAGKLGEKFVGSDIILLYVIIHGVDFVMEYPETVGSEKAEKAFEKAKQELKLFKGLKIRTETGRAVSAADTIVEMADSENVDMIVMGRRGLSNVERFLMGSVSNRVTHYANCSVLTVR